MITFKALGSYGHLGNQLFQFCTTMVHAKKLGVDVGFKSIPFMGMLKSEPSYVTINDDFSQGVNYDEPYFAYRDLPKIKNLNLFGYFQSEKYFKSEEEWIKEMLKPAQYIDDYCSRHLFDNSCSIHIRRGDYLNFPAVFYVQDLNYIDRAIDVVGRDKNFLVFSDDIPWCVENISKLGVKYSIMSGTDREDLYLQSRCEHNIIGNSSFSWWGAWLNSFNNKMVVAPEKWFKEAGPQDNQDLIPDGWIKV